MVSRSDEHGKKKQRAPLTMARTVELLNRSFEKGSNPSIARLATSSFGGRINAFDEKSRTMSMQFRLTQDLCPDQSFSHVLNAFAGACLDAVFSQLVVSIYRLEVIPSTIEYKNAYFRPCKPNTNLVASAIILHESGDKAFMEGVLTEEGGTEVLVKASTTVFLQRRAKV